MVKPEIAFVAGPPVYGDRFFGRRELVDSLIRRILSNASVLLIGQRRIGKSSILHQVNFLKEQGKTPFTEPFPILVRLDGMLFQRETTPDEFARRIANSIFRSTAKAPPLIAKTLRSANPKRIGDRWQVVDALEKVRSLGLTVALLFDEFDDAIRTTEGETAKLLRSFISQGHLVAVCTSYHWPHELTGVVDECSPWFNVFQIAEVGHFTQSESLEMLQTLSELTGYRMSEKECLFLCSVLGNQPFYLQLAGMRLFADYSYASRGPKERRDILPQAVAAVVQDLQWHHDYLVGHLSGKQLAALKRVAKGKAMPELSAKDVRSLSAYLQKAGDRYEINSEVFRQFLLEVPDRKDDASSGVLSRVADFAKGAMETAAQKAIEIAAEKYLA